LLVDEGLGDGSTVALLVDYDSGAEVQQDAYASEHSEQGKGEAHQGRVNAEVCRQTSVYAAITRPSRRAVQALGSIAAWFVHQDRGVETAAFNPGRNAASPPLECR
jgi:hypothetical protein